MVAFSTQLDQQRQYVGKPGGNDSLFLLHVNSWSKIVTIISILEVNWRSTYNGGVRKPGLDSDHTEAREEAGRKDRTVLLEKGAVAIMASHSQRSYLEQFLERDSALLSGQLLAYGRALVEGKSMTPWAQSILVIFKLQHLFRQLFCSRRIATRRWSRSKHRSIRDQYHWMNINYCKKPVLGIARIERLNVMRIFPD